MKVVILAGGYGTRLAEETVSIPKPMVEIGGKPILWHIMKYYASFGFKEFVICLGYKGHIIKEYFYNYWLRFSDVTLKLSAEENTLKLHNSIEEDWKISLIDTGLNSQTGLRIKRIQEYIGKERFMLTYGDGVGNIEIDKLLKNHKESGKVLTITTVQPRGRFGVVNFEADGTITSFNEKGKSEYINAGYMVAEPELFDYLGANEPLEFNPFNQLTKERKMGVFIHKGYWKCMDTISDLKILEGVWASGDIPWKRW